MHGEMIDVPTPDGVADAYLARPDGDGRHPGVLLIMDAIGLRPQIKKMADRVAAEGYVVLAPNIFYRGGRAPVFSTEGMLDDPAKVSELFAMIMPFVEEVTPERLRSDGGAYLDLLEEVGAGPVGITGYCMGGSLGWRIAAAYPDRVRALGAFHAGHLATEAPDSPHRSAGDLKAELFFGWADQDPAMPAEQIAEVTSALDQAGVGYRSEIFAGAEHGYTMADRAIYDEAADERHYRELFALLDRTIAAGQL